jgi:hypothetical protein
MEFNMLKVKILLITALWLMAATAWAGGVVPENLKGDLRLADQFGDGLWCVFAIGENVVPTADLMAGLSRKVEGADFGCQTAVISASDPRADEVYFIKIHDGVVAFNTYSKTKDSMFKLLTEYNYSVTATEIGKEFEENALRAERKYKNGLFGVIGIVESVGKSPTFDINTMESRDEYYIDFDIPFDTFKGLPPTVRYLLGKEQLDFALDLSPGDVVYCETKFLENDPLSLDLKGGNLILIKLTESDLAVLAAQSRWPVGRKR